MAQSRTNIWIDGSQAGATLKDLQKEVNKLNREIKELPRNSDEYKKKVQELGTVKAALTNHQNQIKGVAASYGEAKTGMMGLIKQFAPMAGAAGLVTTGVKLASVAISSWYNNNKEMEKSLSSLKALTGASADDIQYYKNQAKELGKTSIYSASEVVEAYKLIGGARPELLKNKEALTSVTKETITLAEAGEIDLADAASAVAGSLNQFNLSADQSGRIINVLAAGSQAGAAEIEDINASIEKFGTTANSMNVSLEESVGLTELLSEKNLKGAEAGTQLKNVLIKVGTASALPQEAINYMAAYGVNLDIVTNKALPLKDRLSELSKVQQDQNALVKIFGSENIVAGQSILSNINRFEELTTAVTGTNIAYEQAAINTDNLDGDLKAMSSAWEGLTLSLSGGNSIIREVVQAGTDMLNWITNTITAFKEWDVIKLDTSMRQYANTILEFTGLSLIPGVNALQEWNNEQIRFNGLVIDAMDGMQAEADNAAILTAALSQNNAMINSGRLSQETKNKVDQENQDIIATLNEKYPELTANLDLNKASATELEKLNKNINKTLLEQSLNAVQAAESERILGDIIKKQIELNQQRIKESKRWAITNAIADVFSDDAEDIQKSIDKDKKNLQELPKTIKAVQKEIEAINPEYGAKFKANSEEIQNAYKMLWDITQKQKSASGSELKYLDAQEKAMRQQIKTLKNSNAEIKTNAITKKQTAEQNEKQLAADEAAAEERATAAKKRMEQQSEASKKAAATYKKLRDELDKLIESTEKLQQDFQFEKRLDSFRSEQEKEIAELEQKLNEKFSKEIESADKLSKQKGKIGEKATEELNALLALKEEELQYERAKIQKKYEAEQKARVKKFNEEIAAEELKQQRSLEDAKAELTLARAEANAQAAASGTIAEQKAANEELKAAQEAYYQWEAKRQQQALDAKFSNDEISAEEWQLRKTAIEEETNNKIEALSEDTFQQQIELIQNKFQSATDKINQVLTILQNAENQKFENQLTAINEQEKAELASIKKQYDQGLISSEAYESRKSEIETEYANKEEEIKAQQFEANKKYQIGQTIIAGALAVIQAFANLGPIGGAIAAVVLAGTVAAQIKNINDQTYDAEQYEAGGYSNVIGRKDGKLYRAKNIGRHKGGMLPSSPSLALVSEKGPEYFVPNHLLKDQRVIDRVRVIEAIRTNQYADGGFTSTVNSGSGMTDSKLIAFLQANMIMLQSLNQKIPNMSVYIGDKQIDDINQRSSELDQLRS